MSICMHCGRFGGYHMPWCHPAPHSPTKYTRIEWTGNIQVHHPVRPAK